MTFRQNDLTINTSHQDGPRSIRAGHEAADQQALAESAAGNPEAFTGLVHRHAAACLAVARQVLRDEDMAQDAVQEAFLDLWRHAGRYDPGRSAIGPWLVMLSHRRAVDRVRLEQTRPRPTDQIPDVASDFDLEEHATTAILGQHTVTLLRQLPAGQRQCLVLAYWGGFTMREIGTRLDLPVGTVKSRCRTALGTLRVLLHEQGLDSAPKGAGKAMTSNATQDLNQDHPGDQPMASDARARQRDQAADLRDDAAGDRNMQADLRDVAAARRDDLADDLLATDHSTEQLIDLYLAARRVASAHRSQASADRHAEAEERYAAERDRHDAAADRQRSTAEAVPDPGTRS